MSNKRSEPTNPCPATPASVVEALEAALAAVRELTALRLGQKISATPLAGVARELRELVKVMSIYEV